MRNVLRFLPVIFFFVTLSAGHAQSKKELEAQLASSTVKIDSLTKLSSKLTFQRDSLGKALTSMYDVIKEKGIQYDFKMADLGKIIDSLKTKRDSLGAANVAALQKKKATMDSLQIIIDNLNKENGSLKYMVGQYIGKPTMLLTESDLNGTWNFDLATLELKEDSVGAGLIISNPGNYKLGKLSFVDKELMEVVFSNGTSTKCFYKLTGFSVNNPFVLDLKGMDANIRIFLLNTQQGLQVSYKSGKNTYLYGYMKKQ